MFNEMLNFNAIQLLPTRGCNQFLTNTFKLLKSELIALHFFVLTSNIDFVKKLTLQQTNRF